MTRRFESATPWARAPGQDQERPAATEQEASGPARPADLQGDVLVPAIQAGLTGALLGGLVVYGLAELVPGWHVNSLKVWLGLGLAISAGAWVWLLRDSRRLLWRLERRWDRDLDMDGHKGDPTKRTLEVHLKDGRQTRIVGSEWLEIDDDRLVLFAAGILRGESLTEGTWGGNKAVFPKGMNEWRAFRGRLLEYGLIAYVNPEVSSLGYQVTRPGRAFFETVAREGSHTLSHKNGSR